MASLVKQSSTQLALKFLMVQSSDHITGLTLATPTVTIRKEGGTFASPAGAVTEIANGWYQVAGNATDTNTLGEILLHATAASGDPTDIIAALVVSFDPQTTTTQTGDSFAYLGTNVGALGANLTSVNIGNAIFDQANGIETGLTLRQAMRVIGATTCGVITNAGTTTNTFLGAGVGTTRVTATVDTSGNRTAITLSP